MRIRVLGHRVTSLRWYASTGMVPFLSAGLVAAVAASRAPDGSTARITDFREGRGALTYNRGMFALALFAACTLVAGTTFSAALWRSEPGAIEAPPGRAERAASAIVASLAVALWIDWALVPFHAVRSWPLLGCSVALALLAIGQWARARGAPNLRAWLSFMTRQREFPPLAPAVVLSVPLLAWLMFGGWRVAHLPVLNHDALSYHFPRAMDVVRTGTWRVLNVEDFRLAAFPSNYEMLLADVIVLTGSDQLTLALSLVNYVLLLLLAFALVERLWADGLAAWLAVMVMAGSPVLLLQSVGHKSDIMSSAFLLGSVLWGSRWLATGGRAAFLLLLTCGMLGIGTKSTGIPFAMALVVAWLPLGLLRRMRRFFPGARTIGQWSLIAVSLFLLSGGWVHVAKFIELGAFTGPGTRPEAESFAYNMVPRYGRLGQLFTVPFLLLTVPFSPRPDAVWVPWKGEYWFWPRYELYFSHFGALTTLLVAFIPFGLVFWLRHRRGDPSSRERWAAVAGLSMALVILLPMYYRTDGFFCGFPRYFVFFPLLVCMLGLVPATLWLQPRWGPKWVRLAGSLTVAATFVRSAVDVGLKDRFAPAWYLAHVAAHPGWRAPGVLPVMRAAMVVDALAGPNDQIVVDGGFGAWIHPAYGSALSRGVRLLPPSASRTEDSVEDADWVIIDRGWSVIWGSPELVDMGGFWSYVDRGPLPDRERDLARALGTSRKWQLVYDDPRFNQVVFRRAPDPPRHGSR